MSGLKPLYRLVNQFWSEHWTLKEQITVKRKSWIALLKQIHNPDREIVIFGSGNIAKEFLADVMGADRSNLLGIRYMLDNALDKQGMECEGFIIKHPSEIEDWSKLYVIIALQTACCEVKKQLEELGLLYKRDFIYYTDL